MSRMFSYGFFRNPFMRINSFVSVLRASTDTETCQYYHVFSDETQGLDW
jgi:hypothetical protein